MRQLADLRDSIEESKSTVVELRAKVESDKVPHYSTARLLQVLLLYSVPRPFYTFFAPSFLSTLAVG